MTVLEILRQKYSYAFLKGFKKGWFGPEGIKLFAYSILPTNDEHFNVEVPSIQGYSYSYPTGTTDDTFRIYNEEGCYTYKELSQLIDEGVFKWSSIKFYGMQYREEWYLSNQFSFHEAGPEEIIAKKIEAEFEDEIELQLELFENVPEFLMDVDADTVMPSMNEELTSILKFPEQIRSFEERLRREKIPMTKQKQWPNYREFVGQPWIVTYEKEKSKRNLNRAFETYANEEFFKPFGRQLMKAWPEKFYQIDGLFAERGFHLIYPHSKEQVIAAIVVTDQERNSTIHYFLYTMRERKFYQWTLPKPRYIESYFGYVVREDLADLSSWGVDYHIGDPVITMDDESFWSEYVFKKIDDKYIYLKPVEVKNSQPDIYTQW